MIDESKLEHLANKVKQKATSENVEQYHSQFAKELSETDMEYKANPPEGWDKSEFENLNMEGDTLGTELGESTGPVYSFYIDEELYIEIVSKKALMESDFENLKKSVKSSESLIYLPDSISKGVIVNFPVGKDKPEFRWYTEE